MGEVYRADDLELGQTVALKFLREGFEDDPDLPGLLGDVRTARQVTHPNVCRVYDIGETEGLHFLSMEYVDGEDLSSLSAGWDVFPRNARWGWPGRSAPVSPPRLVGTTSASRSRPP